MGQSISIRWLSFQQLKPWTFERLQQSTLNSIVTQEPKQPPFTKNGLLDYTIELVMHEDEV